MAPRDPLLFLRVLLLMAVAGGLSGCFFRGEKEQSCERVEEYQRSGSVPPITVPAGLDRPGTGARLNVPDGPEPAEPLSQNAACLQRPPDYFDRPLYTPAD